MYPLKKESSTDSVPSPNRIWYNEWVKKNAKGSVLDVGKSRIWDYGFPTIDTCKILNPTYRQDICNSNLSSDFFDVVLCNGMYEFVENPQRMVDEVNRITVPKGIAIFGFVGKDYKPYKRNWNYYEEGDIVFDKFDIVEKKDFGNTYHFIICQKSS